MRAAIVGSGISGLGSAWLLTKAGHAVTVFEASDTPGGHSHTVDVTLDGVTAPVDTGFLVFNDRTYPHLVALFGELGVESVPSEMSFSVNVEGAGVEWAGTDLNGDGRQDAASEPSGTYGGIAQPYEIRIVGGNPVSGADVAICESDSVADASIP